MRISGGVNIPLRTIQSGWDFQNIDTLVCHEMAGGATLNFGIARSIDQRREPRCFQLRAAFDEKVRTAHLNKEARLRIDKVRIFSWPSKGRDFDFVAADFFGNSPEIRGGGDDVKLGLRDKRSQQRERGEN